MKCNITVFEFWDLTLGEINTLIDVYESKQEENLKIRLACNYNLATMISTFVNRTLNGKDLPSLTELFPSLSDTPTTQDKEADRRQVAALKEQLLDYAHAHNARRKALKDGENNNT